LAVDGYKNRFLGIDLQLLNAVDYAVKLEYRYSQIYEGFLRYLNRHLKPFKRQLIMFEISHFLVSLRIKYFIFVRI